MKSIKKWKIDFNAPVILAMTGISLILLILSMLFGSGIQEFFGVHYTSWASPLMYMRLFTHIFVHADWAHLAGNFMLILVIGPVIEEKYGSTKLVLMVALTALVTGLISVIFFRNTLLMGASGIVFMFIILASFTNLREGRFPLTVILVAVLYIGNEIITGFTSHDNVAQYAHIIGGLCGGAFGILLNRHKIRGGGAA